MSSLESVSVGDRDLLLYVTAPDSGSGPGILLGHAWWGCNECIRDIGDRLADEGYLVVVPDLYDEDVAETVETAEVLATDLDPTRAIEDVSAAFEYLRDHPDHAGGLGVMGFSLSVYYVLGLVQEWPDLVDAAVIFYGTGDGEFADTDTAVLGHFAGDDPFEPERNVDAFRELLRDGRGPVTFHSYSGVEHWFFESDRPEYDEEAAEVAWSRTVEFLDAEL